MGFVVKAFIAAGMLPKKIKVANLSDIFISFLIRIISTPANIKEMAVMYKKTISVIKYIIAYRSYAFQQKTRINPIDIDILGHFDINNTL